MRNGDNHNGSKATVEADLRRPARPASENRGDARTEAKVDTVVGTNGGPLPRGLVNGDGRRLAASVVRAFAAWLTTRPDTVHAGALEPSDRLYRATLQFLKERGLDAENYDPDWNKLIDDE